MTNEPLPRTPAIEPRPLVRVKVPLSWEAPMQNCVWKEYVTWLFFRPFTWPVPVTLVQPNRTAGPEAVACMTLRPRVEVWPLAVIVETAVDPWIDRMIDPLKCPLNGAALCLGAFAATG